MEIGTVKPYGLTRMKPFPGSTATEEAATAVLDPDTQTAIWTGTDAHGLPTLDRHKRSQTVKETRTQTSLDSTPDEGSDQQGEQD
ncbi:putative ATP-grasp-modified RiPP [Streptomyces sp. NPDC091377]|uniref:putative ATP-grasp-modified RiPP n=1 Tax=Streptomyces sp. NPDC091377 TaxID=3365995 RepID=UPI0037F974A1